MRKSLNSTPAGGNPITARHVHKALKLPLAHIPDSTDATVNSILNALRHAGVVEVPELVANGTFDTDLTGWAALTNPANLVWDSGRIQINNDFAGSCITTVPGVMYRIGFDILSAAGTGQVSLSGVCGSYSNDLFTSPQSSGAGLYGYFTASSTTTYITLAGFGTALYDNISVKQYQAV